MANTGVCCASLEEPKVLMKMGLSMVLVGHVNFLVGALVHGAVLRHINLHKQARAMEYAISNVVALTSGLVGVVVGILAIILSKNKKSKILTWSLFMVSLVAALMATASAVGLMVSVVRTVVHGGRSLLALCRFPDAVGYSSITNECPFDPTRIYSTTLILWVPLIATCIVQLVFSARCFAVCLSFLGLPCCCHRRKRPRGHSSKINTVRSVEVSVEASARPRYAQAPRPQRQHHTLPPSVRQPLHPQGGRPPGKDGDQQRRPPEQHQLLARGALERSSLPPEQHQLLARGALERSCLPPEQHQLLNRGALERSTFPPEHHQLLNRGALERSSFWV